MERELVLPPDWADYAWEVEAKGVFQAPIRIGDRLVTVVFYDPVRLQQDVGEDVVRDGRAELDRILVIPALTESNMRLAVAAAPEGFLTGGTVARQTGEGANLEVGEWGYLLAQALSHPTPERTTVRLPNGSKTTVDSRHLLAMAVQFAGQRVEESERIAVGDIYEDCNYHPVLCTSVDYDEDDIEGISLIDGSQPRSCSLAHCGVRKLTIADVIRSREGAGK